MHLNKLRRSHDLLLHNLYSLYYTECLMCVLQEAFRKAAVAALTKRLQQSVGTATAIAGSELDSLFGVQAQLVQ